MPEDNACNVVCWNQSKGYLAAGGDQGTVKVFLIDDCKDHSAGVISMNQELQGHKDNVCVLAWNN